VKGIAYTTAFMYTLLFFLPQSSFAQLRYINPEVYNEVNGLPNSEVRCLLKDSKGYLWVGTIYGLAKYDGNKFSVYKHQSDRNSISGDVITALFEDKKGNILVGAHGLSVLERTTGVWKNYLHDPNNPFSISSPSLLSIAQENDSIYWIIASNGINKFNIETGKFQRLNFNLNSRIFFSKIHEIIPNKSITFSISSTFYSYNLQYNSYEVLPEVQGYGRAIVFNNSIVGLKSSVLNTHNLFKYNLATNKESTLLTNVDANGTLFCDKTTLYIAYRDRICLFDLNFNLTKTVFFNQPQVELGIEYNDALREENGTFWIATNNGLLKVSPSSPFQFIDSKSGLYNEYVRSLTVDRNNSVWIGVRQGPIYKISNVDNFLINRANGIKRVNFPTPNGEVYATNQILELQNGNLLFVTSSTLYHYNTGLAKFTDQFQIQGNKQFFSAVEVNGGILIGALERPTLFKIAIKEGRIKRDTSFRIDNSLDVVNSLFKDSKGRVWLGGDGLFYLNFRNNHSEASINQVIPSIDTSNHSSNSVWSILEIDNDKLFVSTTTNGYFTFSRDSSNYDHFSKADGIASDFTCGVLKDRHQNLWMTTKEGITFINPTDSSIRNYPIKNGQHYSDFTFKCEASSKGNIMLFGSKRGIVFFNPDSVVPIKTVSPLYINEFRVFDRIVRSELTNGDTIFLNYNENFFSFEFSLLDFRIPQETSYAFQLMNYDRDSRLVTNNFNSASYTDVPPGKYNFSLSAISADYTTQQGIEIIVVIKPAFYQTRWFKASIYFAIALLLAIVVITIVRRQLLRGRLQKMELHLLRSQIDPHFIFNTLTSIQHTILTSSKNVAIESLSKFSKLMRMGLDYSRMEYVPLEKAIHFYQTFVDVHSLNLDEKIEFNVTVDSKIDAASVKISPMLIQPFLENAIVHGLTPKNKDMRIDLKISLANGWLRCIIRDNGIGRKRASEIGKNKAKGHKSVGIEISRKSILAQLKKGRFIKETFSIEDNADDLGNPTGTTVFLKIPFRS
jgi:ligand-binding sensor domain-containing protein